MKRVKRNVWVKDVPVSSQCACAVKQMVNKKICWAKIEKVKINILFDQGKVFSRSVED